MKTVLFVPGFQETINDRDYAATISAIENKGYKVRFVDIQWLRTTIDHWTAELDAVYAAYDPKDTILAGFSFGAVTAFMSATKRSPSELWLFSLSPYFHEEIHHPTARKSRLTGLGHRRVTAFDRMHFANLLKTISSKILFFYGELELPKWPDISNRNQPTEEAKNATVTIVHGVGHDVADPHYINVIVESI